MNTVECIRSRCSVRSFRQDRIPESTVNEILESAICAPSSGNAQDWEFITVTRQETKARLAEAAWGQDFIAQAPLVIVVCSDSRRITSAYGERGVSLYSIQNTAAAAENLILSAWDKGIGCCWVGAFNEEKTREILVLPSHVRPLAIIPAGFPASEQERTGRRSVKEVVHREFY